MSYGDAYADAHLTLESLNADIAEASGMLERAVENWERILSVGASVDVDTAAASVLIEQVASEWNAVIEQNLTGTVDIDTATATAEIATATQTWQSLVESITAQVNIDTDEANDELAATVLVWREAVASNLTATVTMNTDPANDQLVESILAWRSAVQDDLTATVDMRTGEATGELDAASEVWRRIVESSLTATVNMDATGATAELASAAEVWQQIVNRDLVAVVSLSTDRANDTLAAAVLAWRAAVGTALVAEVDIDTEATTGKLLIAVEGWQALLTDGITATVDMDTNGASDRLSVALDEWNVQVGDGVSVGVALDTATPTEELAVAVEEWQALVEDSIEASIDMNTAEATEHLAATVEEWRSLVDPIPANVEMDTGEASAILAASATEWRAIVADAVSARAEMDTAAATDHLAAAVEEWRALTADNLVMDVDLETDAADDHLIETIADWRTRARIGVDVPVNLDLGESGTEFEARLAEWQRLAHIDVNVDVDDIDSLANLATTFAGLRPLTDLPVRFHLDQPSVLAATAEVEALAAAWSEALDLGVRPTNAPSGENDAPVRPGVSPASPRGPPESRPTIRPQVDGTEAESQAALLDKVLTGILAVTTTVRLNEADVLAQTEALAPAIERVLSTSADVKLNGDGAVEYAAALHDLIEQVLSGLQIVPGIDGDRAVAQAQALDALLGQALAVTVGVDLNDDAATAEAIRLSAELDRLLADIDVHIKPDIDDPARVAAQAKALNRLISDVLKVVVPVDLADTEALAQAETLGPLISELMRVTAEVDVDAGGAAAQIEALNKLLDRAVAITVPVDINDAEGIAKATALRTALTRILRDLIIQINLDGADAAAHAVVLREAIERAIGTIHVPTELDTTGAEAHAFLFRETLNKIAGTLHVDVDLDSAGATAKLGVIRSISSAGSAIGDVFSSVGSTVRLAFSAILDGIGGLDIVSKGLENVAKAGGAVEGILNSLGTSSTELGTTASKAFSSMAGTLGSVGGAAGQADGQVAAQVAKMVAAIVVAVPAIGLALAGITTAAAAATAGIMALLAAAGSLVGLAGGFATVAGGIGAVALAAGGLGIALNKDLLGQAKDGLTTLKDAVAAVTRDAGRHILDEFEAPFIRSLTNIAGHAARLTPLLVDPIANAGLKYLSVADSIINSDVGARIADKLGKGAAGFIDQFTGYLPAYADLIDRLLGQTSGLHDLVQAILELGLQGEPLFVAIGNLVSGLSQEIQGFGAIGIPIITRMVDSLTNLVTSDLFDQFLSLGTVALNGILDLVSQITDGIKSVGLGDVFNTIGVAIQKLVDSGVFERVGEMIGKLLELGANILGPIIDTLVTAFDAIAPALDKLIPIIQNVVTVLADNLGSVIQSWADDGVFDKLAEAIGGVLNVVTFLIPPLAELIKMFGGPLAAVLSFVADLFGNYLPRALGFFAEKILSAEGFVMGFVGKVASALGSLMDTIADVIDLLPDVVLDNIPGAQGLIDTLRVGSALAENFGTTMQTSGDIMGKYVAPQARNMAREYANLGDANARSNALLESSNDLLGKNVGSAEQYRDVLGDGVDKIVEFGAAHGFTETQINQAASAAADAAEQFRYSTDLVGKLREELSKPIELKFDFDKTKLNLDGVVKYVDAQVKTVRDDASKPINTDPTTEALASSVKGADGTSLNEATTGSTEQFIPEHLDKSIADAVQEMYDNAVRDIDNASYLKELRYNGFAALADQLEQFDGPKLELAIRELGDSTSKAVRDANAKIESAQKELDQNANPFQAAIDDAKKRGVLKVRQVQIVQDLESKGFNDLASQVAAIKPEDLEAAIRTYENLTPEVVAGMEKQLDDLKTALESTITEIDPIGKMWEAAANTPGAQAGLISKIVTKDQIEAAVGSNFDNHFTAEQQGLSDLLNFVGTAIQSPDGSAVGGMKPEDVQRWKNLFNGFDPKTGKPVENVTDQEAQIIALLQLRQAQNDGKTVAPDGTVSAGQAESSAAGKAVADAFASGMANAETSKTVEAAANHMIGGAVDLISAAVKRSMGTLTGDGQTFVDLIVAGMNIGIGLHLVPAALRVVNTALNIIDTVLSDPEGPIGTGRVLVNSLAVGMSVGAVLRLWPTAAQVSATAVDFVDRSITGNADRLLGLGRFIPNLLGTGSLLGIPAVTGALKIMGDLMIAMIEEQAKRAAFAANLMGQSIGNAVGEGLRSSIARIGLEEATSGAVEKEGGGLIGGGRGRGRGPTKAASDAAAESVTGPGVNIGSAIVDGMIAGMTARLPDLINATKLIAAQMAQTMRDSLGVKSPSRVTMTIGEQVAEGLARGIDQGNDRVLVSARGLGDRVGDAVAQGVNGVTLDGSGLSRQVGEMTDALKANKPGVDAYPLRSYLPVDKGPLSDFPALTPRTPEFTPQFPESIGERWRGYAAPPSVTMPAQTDLLEAIRTAAAGVAPASQGQGATPDAQGGQNPAQALLAGPNGDRALIMVEGDLNINGVPGAEELPQRVEGEFWRIDYGQSPRRPIS